MLCLYSIASWRAYDIAGKLVDDEALQTLLENRQQINVRYDDGTQGVVISDRVQIILGSAIQCAIQSARRYGAKLHFGTSTELNEYYCRRRISSIDSSSAGGKRKLENGDHDGDDDDDSCDIVGLFCGAHTSEMLPGDDGFLLKEQLNVMSWSPELDSSCKMWLRVKVSDKTNSHCTRGGEVGAETWHYTIESARSQVEELERVRANQDSVNRYNMNKLQQQQREMDLGDATDAKEKLDATYQAQKERLEAVIEAVKKGNDNVNGENGQRRQRFDYIFTNAPDNAHNQAKRQLVDDEVVLDGGYTVQVKIATNSVIDSGPLLEKFQTKLLICGGDACVPPNPLAAYGATLGKLYFFKETKGRNRFGRANRWLLFSFTLF
jgi:hypothetical protein